MIPRSVYGLTCRACNRPRIGHDEAHYGRCSALTRAEYQRLAQRMAVGLRTAVAA